MLHLATLLNGVSQDDVPRVLVALVRSTSFCCCPAGSNPKPAIARKVLTCDRSLKTSIAGVDLRLTITQTSTPILFIGFTRPPKARRRVTGARAMPVGLVRQAPTATVLCP